MVEEVVCHIFFLIPYMESWVIESNPTKQRLLLAGMFVVGMVLTIGFRHFDTSGVTDTLAGFLLGLLLIGISGAGFFVEARQTITVNPVSRTITLTTVKIHGGAVTERCIPFDTVVNARVAFLGKASNSIGNTYYVSLSMSDGSHVSLFFPFYFDGRGDETVATERLNRLLSYLRTT